MTNDEKYISEAKARKQLVGFLLLGVLLIVVGLAMPVIVDRFHLGSDAFARRLQWRLPATGIAISCASAYALYKFRPGRDRT